MKMFMLCAVEATITPRMIKHAPSIATYRRPMRSEREPTKGQTAAKARRLLKTCHMISTRGPINLMVAKLTNHVHRSVPPMSLVTRVSLQPCVHSQWVWYTGILGVERLLSVSSALVQYHLVICTKYVDRDLGARPEKCHSNQRHNSRERQLFQFSAAVPLE